MSVWVRWMVAYIVIPHSTTYGRSTSCTYISMLVCVCMYVVKESDRRSAEFHEKILLINIQLNCTRQLNVFMH